MAAETKSERVAATVRGFRQSDVLAVTKILGEAPEAAKWPEESYQEVLTWPGVVALVSKFDGKVTGLILGRCVADEAEILNLAVLPPARRRGEGGALLKSVLEEFRSRGVTRVFLEVRESNMTAITFYTKHGFEKAGRRGGYYRNPQEAAVVMEKQLTQ